MQLRQVPSMGSRLKKFALLFLGCESRSLSRRLSVHPVRYHAGRNARSKSRDQTDADLSPYGARTPKRIPDEANESNLLNIPSSFRGWTLVGEDSCPKFGSLPAVLVVSVAHSQRQSLRQEICWWLR